MSQVRGCSAVNVYPVEAVCQGCSRLALFPLCMQNACMPVNITIRDVPVEVRDELAARASLEGKSMQEYLRSELVRLADKPSVPEWLAGVRERKVKYKRKVGARRILEARDADRK